MSKGKGVNMCGYSILTESDDDKSLREFYEKVTRAWEKREDEKWEKIFKRADIGQEGVSKKRSKKDR